MTRHLGGDGPIPATEAFQSVSKARARTSTTSLPSNTKTTSRFLATDDQAQLREPRMTVSPSMTAPLACTQVAS